MDLCYDAHGYSHYDKGEELRRLGLTLWQQQLGNEGDKKRFSVKYLGCTRIEGFPFQGMSLHTAVEASRLQAAYKAVNKLKQGRKMLMAVSGSSIIVVPAKEAPVCLYECPSHSRPRRTLSFTTCWTSCPPSVATWFLPLLSTKCVALLATFSCTFILSRTPMRFDFNCSELFFEWLLSFVLISGQHYCGQRLAIL